MLRPINARECASFFRVLEQRPSGLQPGGLVSQNSLGKVTVKRFARLECRHDLGADLINGRLADMRASPRMVAETYAIHVLEIRQNASLPAPPQTCLAR